jgi:GT2 family glycosyltransferase
MRDAVTVVVPTRDRPQQLRLCLEALTGSVVEGLEIVVVDDGSSRRSETAAAAGSVGAVLVRLGGEGPAAARNAGARAATGDVILFVDDDCVPAPGWAFELAHVVSRDARLVVAGRVRVPADAGVWLRASEGLARAVETGSRLLRTNNLGCRRSLLLEVPFDERFRSAAGEDRDWCVRVAGTGAKLVRAPAATVEHHARLGARGFFAQQLRYGRAVRELQRHGTHARVPGGAMVRAVADGARDGIGVGAAMLAAQAAVALGYLLEMLSKHPARV